MRKGACTALAAGVLTAAALLATGCGGGGTTLVEAAPPAGGGAGGGGGGGDWAWSLPAQFPAPKVPDDNPMTQAKVELGRFLFHDRRLSGDGTLACAGCHEQAQAFSDGRARPRGITGVLHPRSAQHLSNVVFHATLTWANPSLVTLEQQMLTPLFGDDPVEMGVDDSNRDTVLQRLRDDAAYPARFAAAFPGVAEPIAWPQVIQAVASFQRALVSADSRYDRWLQGRETLSASETRGMNLFFGEKAECFHCHGSFNFNDQIVHARSRLVETPFHNTGLYNIGGTGAFPEPNRGVFELSARVADMGAFRAPSLRNVEVTAPYMHDGSVATLEDVLRHYAAGGRLISSGPLAGDGRANPYKSDLIARIDLDAQEQADIVAFLKTLTDRSFLTDPRFADPFAAAATGASHAR